MNIRWLWFDYSDPSLPLTMKMRMRVAFRFVPIWKLPAGIWIGRLAFVLCITPVALLPQLVLWAFSSAGRNVFAYIGIGMLLWLPMFWVWACAMYGVTCRREHYHRIRLEGFDICTSCGYWLRGLGDGVKHCPECGTERTSVTQTKLPSGEVQ